MQAGTDEGDDASDNGKKHRSLGNGARGGGGGGEGEGILASAGCKRNFSRIRKY